MNPPLCVGIIPARYASTRFFGKPLHPLLGRPMIQWVYEQALQAQSLSRVIVAADDERVAAAVRSFGGQVVMTSPDHACGTDRLAEAAHELPDAEILVNIQGDEPLIAPESIDLAVAQLVKSPEASMSTLATSCSAREFVNPNVVKVVLDQNGFALYFSRSQIPYPRAPGSAPCLKHVGLYAYRRPFLIEFSSSPPSPLEKSEALEQLRVLEMGHRITCALTPYNSIGVDVPEDVPHVEELLRRHSISHKPE